MHTHTQRSDKAQLVFTHLRSLPLVDGDKKASLAEDGYVEKPVIFGGGMRGETSLPRWRWMRTWHQTI
eukprot:c2977_g1_i1 orf=193-396(+)